MIDEGIQVHRSRILLEFRVLQEAALQRHGSNKEVNSAANSSFDESHSLSTTMLRFWIAPSLMLVMTLSMTFAERGGYPYRHTRSSKEELVEAIGNLWDGARSRTGGERRKRFSQPLTSEMDVEDDIRRIAVAQGRVALNAFYKLEEKPGVLSRYVIPLMRYVFTRDERSLNNVIDELDPFDRPSDSE